MRVVIAVNDGRNIEKLVEGALHYGVSDRDEIAVITVINSGNVNVWSFLPPALIDEIKKDMDCEARSTLRKAGLFLRTELHTPHVHEFKLDGDLADQLNDFLINWKADLLIIGFTENPPWADHASKIVSTSPCPVLAVGRKQTETETDGRKSKQWHEPSYIV